MEGSNLLADGLEHTLHLMEFTFLNNDLNLAGALLHIFDQTIFPAGKLVKSQVQPPQRPRYRLIANLEWWQYRFYPLSS